MSLNIDEDTVFLTLPHIGLIPSYIEALREGFVRGIQPVKGEDDIKAIENDPAQHLKDINSQEGLVDLPDGRKIKKVPHEALWLSCGQIFIGEFSFRHKLNENLERHGGHIGYGIRPSLCNQGLATLGLKLNRKRAAEMGLEKLLLTCSPDNPASEKVIVKNDGVYIDTVNNGPDFGLTKRFWVPTA